MIEIPLTQGKVALIDAKDWDLVKGYKWSANRNRDSDTFYATCSNSVNGIREPVQMHRLILSDAKLVDHINGDGLDNRRSNLRSATVQINNINRRKQRNNTSGYTGVSWNKADQTFHAAIRVSGTRIHLGRFKTAFEAALVYDRALTEWAGEYGVYNFKGVSA